MKLDIKVQKNILNSLDTHVQLYVDDYLILTSGAYSEKEADNIAHSCRIRLGLIKRFRVFKYTGEKREEFFVYATDLKSALDEIDKTTLGLLDGIRIEKE